MDQKIMSLALNWLIIMAPLIKWWAKIVILNK